MKIHIASDLHQRFASLGVSLDRLVDAFEKWKSDPDGRQTLVFGRDIANTGSRYVRHVHMIPVNLVDDLAVWKNIYAKNKKFKSNRPQLSDRYLIYADGGRYGYLIIDMINDPGAHEIWTARFKRVRDEWEEIASDFVCLGKIP
ncbi:hypothetical protein [Massilia genomosp. 1]|uniref:Uncharacterized protein n=1 Tax=Massilia genomosp. 1 TaxID=2609280 RepID=A0ABX0MKB2_9BURK|nr:hypothetical protein [Massilia genomosp. 1]NHZ60913.1 hypothetical protein [Massilia genomosp. 1]